MGPHAQGVRYCAWYVRPVIRATSLSTDFPLPFSETEKSISSKIILRNAIDNIRRPVTYKSLYRFPLPIR